MSSRASNGLLEERAREARDEYPRLIDQLVEQAVAAVQARRSDHVVTEAERERIRNDIEQMVDHAAA